MGVYAKNIKNFEKKIGLPDLVLFNPNSADSAERGAIKSIKQKIKRLFKILFHNYANMFKPPNANSEFDNLTAK